MSIRLAGLLLTLVIAPLLSCKKSGLGSVQSGVTGTWTWVESALGNTLYPSSSSAVQKKVVFYENGAFSLTHNDSSSGMIDLIVSQQPVLRTTAVTDTGSYHLQMVSAACVNYKYPALVLVGQADYQYRISGDTLRVARPPCLAPLESVFIRSN
jgi:hypothetical protein